MLLTVLLLLAQVGGHYEKGAAFLRSGKWDEAVAELEKATLAAPGDARGWKGLGVAYASRRNFRRAEQPLRKACDLDPRDQDACYYLGLASYHMGRYENALAAYQKARKAGARQGIVRTGVGLALEALGQVKEAERELSEAVLVEDGKSLADFDPRVEFGAFLYRQGRKEEALRALQEAVRSRPDSPRAHFELGRTLVQFGQLDNAVKYLKQAVILDPAYAAAHLLLGRTFFRLGQNVEGERHMALGQRLSAQQP